MPIPIQKGRSQDIDKQIARLQAEKTGATKDVRRLLQKALIASIEADNGVDGANERMLVLIDAAIERGMANDAITSGPGMTGKIATLLDRTPALDHACGLLYEAADLLAEAGNQADANKVKAVAESINSAANVEQWRTVSKPVTKVRDPSLP